MIERQQILQIIRNHLKDLRNKYGVVRIGIFGSVSRNEATSHSDIDIAVELESNFKTLHNYLELERYLSQLLGAPVDLGIEGTLKPEVRERVHADMIYA